MSEFSDLTRLTCNLLTLLKMTRFDMWPVLARDPIDMTQPARFATSTNVE